MVPSVRYPVSGPQRDIWVAHARFPEIPQFNIYMYQRFLGQVDIGLLQDCIIRAVRRNDALRLRFAEEEGVPCQWADETPVVDVLDFSGADDPKAECENWISDSFDRPLDIQRDAVAEVAILKESDNAAYLFVKAHHIVTDAWGLNLLFNQVRADYARMISTGSYPDQSPPSYLSLAEDARRYEESPVYQRDRAYFRAALEGVSPPVFTRRAPSGERCSARYTFWIPRDRIDEIRNRGESPFAFIAAAFALYLSRVHQSAEVVLGVPMLNRHGREERQAVGHFVNTLPLRVSTQGARSVRELVTAVQDSTRQLQEHERLPVGDVLRDRPAGEARQLFDVTLSYVQWPRPHPVPGLRHETGGGTRAHDQDAMAIVVNELDSTSDVAVTIDYCLDVFDADYPVEALARHVQNLLYGALAHPASPLAAIWMLDPAEHADLIGHRNATSADFPAHQTLHGLFEEQAARTPGRTAIAAEGSSLSYAELDAEANRLARILRDDGVRPDDRVAVLMERGPRMLVAILAVLKAGGAYVPVNPGYPPARIRFLLEDSDAAVVLVDSQSPEVPPGTRVRVRKADALAAAASEPLPPVAAPGNLAYVIYTSGSTGQPKGVMVEHRSAVNRLTWMQRRYPIGDGDVLLQKTPTSFDVSVWELFWWAITGARLAVPPEGAEKDPEQIARAIARERVSVIHFVPSMLGPFLDLVENSPVLRDQARSLRLVFCSGEALPPSQVLRFNRVLGTADARQPRLVNLYGPTEAAVDVTYYNCPEGVTQPVTRVPIGRPIDNIRLYVLGPGDSPQPAGVPGELCISGVGVARGYLGRPELTRDKFVPDPFAPGDRMYRTGDLARWLADGNLEYLGRTDDQVKIRGNRVELGEIEHRLASLPGMRAAVVTDRQSAARGTYLTGYYVADDLIEPAQIRRHLAEALPEFMIPAHFMRVDHIPVTANGKADRRALPSPPEAGAPAETAAPGADAAAVLRSVWSEVLGVPKVDLNDDYYVLGGDSILMLRIRAEAAKRGIHVSVADMVANPTVAALAARATMTAVPGTSRHPRPFELIPGIDRAALAEAADAYPVTRMQLGVLYHSRELEGSAVYRDVFRYTFAAEWDERAFRWAFDRLVARHPVLRCSFDLGRYSVPVQIVHSEVTGGLSTADLRSVGAYTAERLILKHIDERRLTDYAIEEAPLYHFRAYVRPSALDLIFSFHHAILDGWSAATLIRDLFQDYLHRLNPAIEPVTSADPPSPAAYVLEERSALDRDDSRRYWQDALEGASLVQIDPFIPHEAQAPRETMVRWFDLTEGLGESVRKFAAAHAVHPRSVFLAAHCLMLRLLAGAEDVTTGLFTHGRPEVENSERVTGLFLNTIPIRLRPGQPTWRQVVLEVQQREREAHPHRRYPLSAIQDERGGDAILETAFNYVHLHVLDPLVTLSGLTLLDVQAFEETNFALIVHAIVDPRDQLTRLRLDCHGRSFTESQVGVVAQSYLSILRQIVEYPGDPVSFGFLAPPPRAVPRRQTAPRHVVDRFNARVAEQPEKIAVAMRDQQWTYRRLGAETDRIGRHLLTLGASSRECVGIAMDRSPEMIAAVLGILKTGAACVPLDVTYPPERIAAMIEIARPLRVLAHSRHAGKLPDESLVIPVESIPASGDGETGRTPMFPERSLEDIACILFTSGSTGRPKGVELPHRPFAYYLEWQLAALTGAVGDSTLQFAPLSFDVSFQEIFSTLSGGGVLQLVEERERRDPAALVRLLDSAGVARVFVPYVALQQLAETAGVLGIRPRRLRVIISSGEQLRITEEIRRLCAALPGTVLENQYGPTETHLVSKFTMTGDPARFPSLPPIGPPMDYLEVHVLDQDMRPVPPGVAGEIYVGGVGLAHGYRRQPELTDSAFIPHPWEPGARLYRTGDIARILPGGDMVYIGRRDSQVKVRGFRVELAEVEFALLAAAQQHPGIREVAVVTRRRDAGDAFLAAFLVGDPAAADLDDVRKRLRATLPDHMVPSYFTWLPDIPRTPSGKRDDAVLRAAPLTVQHNARPVPPGDVWERALHGIFTDLLRPPGEFGIHDDFFTAGGTSLTAMRLIVMIEKHFGTHLPLPAFVAAPTVAELARRLRSGAAAPTFDPLVPIRANGSRRPLFLVHPLGGNVLCYVRLARHLPGDQPLYALQAAGAAPGTEPVSSMEGLADSYLEAIRRVQPTGPYTIGGWSFGGFVAFEMARRLSRADGEVGQVILLDSISPEPGRRPSVSHTPLLEWFFWELLWTEQGGSTPVEGLPARLETDEDRLGFIADRAAAAGIIPDYDARTAVRRLFQVYKANWAALLNYRPSPADFDLTLLRATEPLPPVLWPMHGMHTAHQDPANGWGSYTSGRVDVISVPGDHLVLLDEPNVQSVARAVMEATDTRRHEVSHHAKEQADGC